MISIRSNIMDKLIKPVAEIRVEQRGRLVHILAPKLVSGNLRDNFFEDMDAIFYNFIYDNGFRPYAGEPGHFCIEGATMSLNYQGVLCKEIEKYYKISAVRVFSSGTVRVIVITR